MNPRPARPRKNPHELPYSNCVAASKTISARVAADSLSRLSSEGSAKEDRTGERQGEGFPLLDCPGLLRSSLSSVAAFRSVPFAGFCSDLLGRAFPPCGHHPSKNEN